MKKIMLQVLMHIMLQFTAISYALPPVPLPQTGQTACYDSLGTVISCSETGQDGEMNKGLFWPTPRFIDNNNGTITDKLTGLIWMKNANCSGSQTWEVAVTSAHSMASGQCGLTDASTVGQWRLPNRNELESLVNHQQANPEIWLNAQGFNSLPNGNYWSSSTTAYSKDSAYYVGINHSNNNSSKASNYNILLVRTGQSNTAPTPVARTGQVSSYVAGDDGDIQSGIAWPNQRFSNSDSEFKVDTLTGLIWTNDANAPGPTVCNPGVAKTWQGALDHVKCLNANNWLGHNDWTLPNIIELSSVVNIEQTNPASWLRTQGFINVQDFVYWSSTTNATGYYYGTASARSVHMTYGWSDYGNKSAEALFHVWPVRSSQAWLFDPLIILGSTQFGSHRLGGDVLSRQVILGNHGETNIKISSIETIGLDATEFTVTTGGSTPCVNLTPNLELGASCTILVSATPTSVGAKSASLSVVSDNKTVNIPLAATAITTVYGDVTDYSTGLPIIGATVKLTQDGNAVNTVITTSEGKYNFGNLAANSYSVTVSKTGYQSITKTGLYVTTTSNAAADILLPTVDTFNITTLQLPSATVGEPYSSRVMVAGGTSPYAFSVSYSALPSGLTLDSATGLISGTPTGTGSYVFAVSVSDAASNSAESFYSIDLTPSFAITTPAQLPRATIGMPVPTILSASGGLPGYTFSGTLPAGLTLASNGQIHGAPTTAGTFHFTVTAIDSTGRPTTRQFTLSVDQPLAITTPRLDDASVGSAYSQTISSTGGYGSKNWSLYSGVLPQGLAFDPANGVISGTPLEAVTRRITLELQDAAGRMTYRDYTLTASKPLALLTSILPNVHPGRAYNEKIRVAGGIKPYTYSMTGALPTGLALDTATGTISGTTTSTGLKNVGITITDSSYPTPKSVTSTMGIRVNNTLVAIQAITPITSALLPNAAKNVAISPVTFSAGGGSMPYTWTLVGGALPNGLSFDGTTGTLTGTPTLPGDFSFILHLADAAGNMTNDTSNPDKTFFMHVSDTLAISTTTLPVAAVGKPFSVQLDATGGFVPYSWNIAGLPGDLSYNPVTGVISGTPTASSNNTLTVSVSDSDTPAQLVQATMTLDVSSQMTILETTLPDARLGQSYTANVGAHFGIAPYNWNVASGNLPSGISLQQTASGIVLTGIPFAEGIATFTLELTDSAVQRQTVSRQFTISTLQELQIGTANLATVPKGNPYSQPIAVSGGKPPYTFTVSGGNLLQGLSLNSVSGEIGGILAPTAVQSGTVTIRVSDAGMPSASVEKQYTLTASGGFSVSGSVISGSATGTIYCSGPPSAGGSASCTVSPMAGYVLKLLTDNSADVTASVTSGSYTIASVTADHAVVATFGLATPSTLTLQKSEAAAGIISSSPSGISCDSACISTSAAFNEGATVVLTAQPAFGYYFLNWQGCTTANANQCTITISQGMQPVNANFSTQKPTTLSISPLAKALSLNQPLTMSGQLATIPSGTSTDISSQPITVTIKDPGGTTTTYTTSTKDSDGHWDITLTSFTARGSYIVRAAYAGALKLMASQSDTASVMVEKSAGYAIIIQGKIPGNEGLDDHRYTTDNIVSMLKSRSFLAEDINYLTSSNDSAPTKADIQAAIETWARDKMNAIPAPLYIVMVNHGTPSKFHIGSESVTPADLNTWITNLENSLTTAAAAELRNIIIGTCYSGSFIPALTKSGRVIVTSASDDEESIRGGQVPTSTPGVFARSGEYFLDELFASLNLGENLKRAFVKARDAVNAKDPRTVPEGAHAGVFDTIAQHALINDSGNGNGSYQLDGAQDGALAENIVLGEGVVKTNAADNPSDIKETAPTQFLASTDSSATLWLKPNLNSRVDSAWIEIRKPGTITTSPGTGSQVIIPLETVTLTFNAGLGRWETTYAGFTTSGSYDIYYYTRDSQTRFVSSPVRSIVYRDKSANTAPTAFNLLNPTDQSQQKTLLVMDWQKASDSDPVTYTLMISKDANFTTNDHTQTGLTASTAVVGPMANLTDNSTYYWKVLAIDAFGATRQSSQVWRFNTANAGVLPGIVRGMVRSTMGAPVAGATVSTTGISVTTAENGSFQFAAPAGSYDITVNAAGFAQSSRTGLIVAAGAVLAVPDVQMPPNQYLLTINTGLNGRVSSIPMWMTCAVGSTTCSGSFPYGTSVTLTPAPLNGYLFSGWSGGSCSGLEPCTFTITENTNLTAGFGQALTLSVTMPGDGGGSVNSNPSGIACASGSSAGCSASFPSGNTVTLMPLANSVSTFDGWSVCSGTGNCAVSINSAKSVAATFSAAPKAMIGTKGYKSLSLAYSDIANGGTATILVLGTDLGTEILTVSNDKKITLIGGHTVRYAKSTNATLLKGPLTIGTGSLTLDGLVIK